jgi:hypothetical protein
MCMDCGCHKVNDDHGDRNHITYSELERAARASGVDPETAVERIRDEARRVARSGQHRQRDARSAACALQPAPAAQSPQAIGRPAPSVFHTRSAVEHCRRCHLHVRGRNRAHGVSLNESKNASMRAFPAAVGVPALNACNWYCRLPAMPKRAVTTIVCKLPGYGAWITT